MRPLTEEACSCSPAAADTLSQAHQPGVQETTVVFQKLHSFIGKSIKHLVERPDESYVFRLHHNKVLYVRASIMKRATNVRPCRQPAHLPARPCTHPHRRFRARSSLMGS